MQVIVEGAEVRKRATTDHERARLAHEASVLAALDHPGVVRLVRHDRSADVLVTTALAGASLATATLAPRELAAVAASVASTLRDLHERDCAHGAVTPDHVLVAGGTGVLCSLGSATSAGPLGGGDDVRALGETVLRVIAGPAGELGLLRPDTRPRRRQGDAAAVVAVARRMAAGTIGTAADAADALRLVAGDHLAPMLGASRRRPGAVRLPRRRVLAAGGVVALTAIGLGIGAASGARSPADHAARRSPAVATAPAPSVTNTAPTPGGAGQVWPSGPTGDEFADGVLTTALGRFGVGRAGDQVVVADLDCDGTATPAHLARPAGTVAVYDRWPAAGETVAGRVVATWPHAEALLVRRTPTCDRLWVRLPGGSVEEVPAP